MSADDVNDIITRMWLAGEEIKRIADATGLTPAAVKWRRRQLGLVPRTRGAAVMIDDAEVARLREDGFSMTEIAERIGASRHSVANSLQRSGRRGPGRPRGGIKRAKPRRCLRCRQDFVSPDPPAIRSICGPCSGRISSICDIEHSVVT